MTQITKEAVFHALSHVEDPDLKKDLVTLRMIRDVEIAGATVTFTLVLTTPACPLKELLKDRCTRALHEHVSPSLSVTINLDARVTTSRSGNEKVLSGIKNIIGVASGKGGVGKSTVAVNLAIGLAKTGARAGLIDADIHGPSVPAMLGLTDLPDSREENGKTILLPGEKFGIKALSMGMLVGANQPLVWRGPMLSSALKQMMLDVDWGELDYLVLDLPPGTGDVHLTLSQQFPLNGVVMVTTPQDVSLNDTRKSIEMFRSPQINIPILGIVENMSWFTPEELPEHRYYIFGKGGGKKLADAYEVPLIQQIPLIMGVSEDSDAGKPAVLHNEKAIRRPFMDMAGKTAQEIARLNARAVAI